MSIEDLEIEYRHTLETVADIISDAIEGGRLNASDIPDDYQALVGALIGVARAYADMCAHPESDTSLDAVHDDDEYPRWPVVGVTQ